MAMFRLACAAACLALLSGAAQAGTLDDIKAKGTMVVAIDPTFAPYEYTDASGGITGYDPALLALIAKDLGVKVEFRTMAFSGIIPGLIAGSFDFTATALNVTAERAQRIAYTIPVSATVNAVMRRKGDTRIGGASPDQLAGFTGAVKQTTEPEKALQAVNAELAAASKKSIAMISVDTTEQTVTALGTMRADFILDDRSVLAKVMKERPGQFEIVGDLGKPQYIAWGTRKSDPELTAALDAGLKKLKESGQMKALQEQYLGTTFDLPEKDFIPAAP